MTSPPKHPDGATDMELFDLRVTVDRIEGRSVCGMRVGDYFELVNSAELRLPPGRHFCVWALQAVLPFLAAKQRQLPAGDWLERDTLSGNVPVHIYAVSRDQRNSAISVP